MPQARTPVGCIPVSTPHTTPKGLPPALIRPRMRVSCTRPRTKPPPVRLHWTPVRRPETDVRRPETPVRRPETDVCLPQTPFRLPETDVRRPETDVGLPRTPFRLPETDVRRPETDVRLPQTDVRVVGARAELADAKGHAVAAVARGPPPDFGMNSAKL